MRIAPDALNAAFLTSGYFKLRCTDERRWPCKTPRSSTAKGVTWRILSECRAFGTAPAFGSLKTCLQLPSERELLRDLAPFIATGSAEAQLEDWKKKYLATSNQLQQAAPRGQICPLCALYIQNGMQLQSETRQKYLFGGEELRSRFQMLSGLLS